MGSKHEPWWRTVELAKRSPSTDFQPWAEGPICVHSLTDIISSARCVRHVPQPTKVFLKNAPSVAAVVCTLLKQLI